MKYLYLVDYWLPFPASEYGGTLSVIGENDNEVHDLILDWRDEFDSQYDSRIMERIVNAHKFALAENETSRIVDTFTT
jgi:hypothetical protein